MNIDMTTVFVMIILGHLFSAILGAAYMTNNKKDTAFYVFLLARMFNVFAGILVSMNGNGGFAVSLVSLLIADTLQIFAFLMLKDQYNNSVKYSYSIGVAFYIAVYFLIRFVFDIDGGASSALISAFEASLWGYPIYVLFKDKKASVLQRVVANVYAIELVLLIVRAYMGLKLGGSISFTSNSVYNVLYYIILYLVMLIGNIGFILMAKEKADIELVKAATYDDLTNIYNRRTFLLCAEEIISLFAARKEPVSLLMMDIDQFKIINDTYGHVAGDMALKNFAEILQGQLQGCDLFGRFGGEEFAILIPGADREAALKAAEGLRKVTENAYISVGADDTVNYTISTGIVTVIPDETTTIDMLYKLSDDALYAAKNRGRNCIEIVGLKH